MFCPFPQQVSAVLLLLLMGSTSAPGRLEAEEGPFAAFEDVTAADLLVELDEDLERDWQKGELQAADLEILLDGETAQIVGVEGYVEEAAGRDPWHLLLYLDLDLLSTNQARRAVRLLASASERLIELGTVEVIVADPHPRRALPPTRDLSLLEQTLAQLALQAEGRDSIVELRGHFEELARQEQSSSSLARLAELSAESERQVIQLSLDRLLNRLVDGPSKSPRRAVFYATLDLGLSPGSFDGGAPVNPDPSSAMDSFARTAAGYNWILFPLLPEPPPDDRWRGWRLGKWRFSHKANLLFASYEEDRDPEKANAYLALAVAHREAEEWEESAEAYRQAIFHFKGDPRTQGEEIEALQGLRRALEALGQEQEAREVERIIADLRRMEAEQVAGTSAPKAGFSPLLPVAETTAGSILREVSELEAALDSLARRIRLTYQMQTPEEPEILPVEARSRGEQGQRLRSPTWIRRSIPASIPRSRARRLLAGDTIQGELEVEAELESYERDGREALRLHIDVFAESAVELLEVEQWRLTVLSQDEGERPSVIPVELELELIGASLRRTGRAELDLESTGEWLAVVLEELRTGFWGATLSEGLEP